MSNLWPFVLNVISFFWVFSFVSKLLALTVSKQHINLNRSVALPELRRLRRTFLKLAGQSSLSGPPPPSDAKSAKRMFADYLNGELSTNLIKWSFKKKHRPNMSLKLLDVEIVIGLHKECVVGICASFVNQEMKKASAERTSTWCKSGVGKNAIELIWFWWKENGDCW